MSPRDRILSRRAKFIAAAFVGITGCSDDASPQPAPQVCLTGKPPDTGIDAADAADTQPQVCLAPEPPDSSVDTASDDAEDASEDGG